MSSTPSAVTKTRTTLTIDQIRVSPFNVRTDAAAISAQSIGLMEELLIGQGQLEEILVHPMRGNTKVWGAHAGGRRYRAFKNLVESGRLPRDHPIKVEIRDGMSDAELVEESMSENIGRRDLEPYETFAGVRKAHRLGHSIKQIATALGQEDDAIGRMLRLGNLARPIFEALAAGQISTEQARAFGATEDIDVQLAAWEKLRAGMRSFTHPADSIRAAIGIGNQELTKLLAYVGANVYVAAGGRLEPDLFATGPDARGRIVDPDKLRELADAALDRLRTDVRRRTGRADLRFIAQEPRSKLDTTDYQLRVTESAGDGDVIVLPDGDIVARVFIDHQSKAKVDYWWASRSAKFANNRGTAAAASASERTVDAAIAAESLRPAAAIGQQYDNSRQVADAAIREEEGLSADSVSIFRSVRRAILRGMLVADAIEGGTVAQDYLVWTQLRLGMDMDARPSKLGIAHKIGADSDPEIAVEHVRPLAATAIWRDAADELRQQSFITGENLPDAFSDFRASSQRLKDLAAAIVAGWSLERSLAADGYVVPVHDELARQLGVYPVDHDAEVRRYWTPTEQLLGRIPTRQALAIAEPFVEPEAFPAWGKAKAAEIVRRLAQIVTGQPVRGLRADRPAVWRRRRGSTCSRAGGGLSAAYEQAKREIP